MSSCGPTPLPPPAHQHAAARARRVPPSPAPRRVNCPFWHKIGACRHGDRCSRAHNKPLFSQTVCLKGMYQNPIGKLYGDSQRAVRRLSPPEERAIQDSFEDFYIDVFDEVAKLGEVEDLLVCDNLGDHLIGAWWRRGRCCGRGAWE